MPIIDTDIKYRLTGGTGNTNANASLGGGISNTEITTNVINNLFDNVTGTESGAGDVEYRCIAIINTHATLTYIGAKIYIAALTSSSDDEIDIGLGTTAVGTADEQLVGSESTAPSSVTFSRPTTSGAALVIGDIPPGSHKSIWIRRTVNAGAAAFTNDNAQLMLEGETLA